ncbi:hypothetical protein CAT62_08085 [Acinetobacter pittii]|nr:hypothetical protein CAT62_08085 [Acinetobacter pittii]
MNNKSTDRIDKYINFEKPVLSNAIRKIIVAMIEKTTKLLSLIATVKLSKEKPVKNNSIENKPNNVKKRNANPIKYSLFLKHKKFIDTEISNPTNNLKKIGIAEKTIVLIDT